MNNLGYTELTYISREEPQTSRRPIWLENQPFATTSWDIISDKDLLRIFSDQLAGAFDFIVYPPQAGVYCLLDKGGDGIEIDLEAKRSRQIHFCHHEDRREPRSLSHISLIPYEKSVCTKCRRVQYVPV